MILIPEAVWDRLLDEFARTVRGVERVGYIDGVTLDGIGVATTVTIPNAELDTGYFDVCAEAMSQAGAHLREHELTRLAQVHTHGFEGCLHSSRDDEMAYSQLEGALSIVLPFHAARRPAPHDGVVHLRGPDGWKPLATAAAAQTVRQIPSVLDYRSEEWIESPIATKAPSMGFWRRLTRLVWRRSP